MILESVKIDYSKPKKYSDLRKIIGNKNVPFTIGENYYIHQLIKFPRSVQNKKYKYKEFVLDLKKIECSCEDQQQKREEYEGRDIRKLCKHLYYKISSSWIKKYIDPLSMELMKNAALFGEKHLYRYEYKSSTIIFGFNEKTKWVNVYAPNIHEEKQPKRYSYNVVENRWSYNSKPKYALLFEDVIKRLIKYSLPFEHTSLKRVDYL